MRGLATILSLAALCALLLWLHFARSKEVLVVIATPDDELASTYVDKLSDEAKRFRVAERYKIRFVSKPISYDVNRASGESVNAIYAIEPDIVIAMSHQVALQFASQRPTTRVFSLLFSTRENPAEIASLAEANGFGATGTRSIGAHDNVGRAQLLREWTGEAKHVGVLWDQRSRADLEDVLASLKPHRDLNYSVYVARVPADFDTALRNAKSNGVDVMLVGNNDRAAVYAKHLAEAAMKYRMPLVSDGVKLCDAAPAICYFTSTNSHTQRWIEAIIQILNGVPAAKIPVAETDRGYIICNAQAAKEIGHPLPETIVRRADYCYGHKSYSRLP